MGLREKSRTSKPKNLFSKKANIHPSGWEQQKENLEQKTNPGDLRQKSLHDFQMYGCSDVGVAQIMKFPLFQDCA